jgi:tetratricopeptide (TPR) repeat protein
MSLLSHIFDHLRPGRMRKRRRMPAEVRDLIEKGELDLAEQAVELLDERLKRREAKAECLRGEIQFHRRNDQGAEEHFRRSLALDAGLPDAHYGLSLVLHAKRDLEAALRHAQFSVNGNLGQPRFYAQVGLCQLELNNYARAENALMQATRLAPNDKFSWNNLGIAQRARGNLKGARLSFRRALELDPEFASAAANARQLGDDAAQLGLAEADLVRPDARTEPSDGALAKVLELERRQDMQGAIDACEELVTQFPAEPSFVIELARLYRANGDPQSGIDALRAFLAHHPDEIRVIAALGKVLADEHEPKAAEPLLVRALAELGDEPELLHKLADIRNDQDRIFDAGELYDRAFELAPTLENKGRRMANLISRCRYEEALALVDEMLVENPLSYEDVVGFQVYALTHLGRHEEALPLLDKALADKPNDPNRRFPRATIHLHHERFAQGWEDYRFRNLASTRHLRMLPFPEWQGEPLSGKAIVVLAEQGLGDQVMFASCLPDLLRLGPGRVVVEAVDRVAPTLARSFPECEVIATRQDNKLEWVREVGAADYFVPMGDLPRQFRRSREDFPRHQGYLKADPGRVAHWRQELGQRGARPKIGVSWRGGTEGTRRVLRTLDVTMLKPLFDACDADWVCLQYGDVDKDLQAAAAEGLNMAYWPESIKDLDEFAALIGALDLVVTVCNTTVHYAGALGKPVWVLAPHVPEWRYGMSFKSMPWYPSSVIYRQTAHGDWDEVLGQVAADLGGWGQRPAAGLEGAV